MKKFALILIALLGLTGTSAVATSATPNDAVICINGICIGDSDRNRDRNRDRDYDRGYDRDYDRDYDRRNSRSGDFVRCESIGSRYNQCYIRNNFRARGIRLVDQHSRSSCRQGRDWGYNGNSIWVDNGCRATFRLVRY